jgi:hypothetical protein
MEGFLFATVWILFIHALDTCLAFSMAQKVLLSEPVELFGPISGWDLGNWRTVDDRVRGGSSQSSLIPYIDGVLFKGILDTKTLGGAGFASQQYWFNSEQEWIGSNQKGLAITFGRILNENPKEISINLFNEYPQDRGDGRRKSNIAYKNSIIPEEYERQILYFDDFKPTFRGRDKPDAPPLDLSQITGLSIMMQSFFDKQQGSFQIEIVSIEIV